MADDSELCVSFTADTSGLEDGAQTAAGVIDIFRAHVAEVDPLADQLTSLAAMTTALHSQIAASAAQNDQKIAASAAQSGQKIAAGNRSVAEQYTQVWSKTVASVVDTFGDGLLGMARGTQTFHTTVLKVAESVENVFVKAIERTVVSHVLGENTKAAATTAGQAAQTASTTAGQAAQTASTTAGQAAETAAATAGHATQTASTTAAQAAQTATVTAGQATQTAATAAGVANRTATQEAGQTESLALDLAATLKKITNAAAAAAAASFQAFVGIPIVGPALGAAAAAATFVAVEAFGALASAEGGYDIGSENPIVQAHAREMVLPASIADPLRSMIASGGAGGAGGSGGFGGAAGAPGAGGGSAPGTAAAGAVTTHNWNIQALDSRSFARTLNTPAGRSAVRNAAAAHLKG